jgi:hypothetical protein
LNFPEQQHTPKNLPTTGSTLAMGRFCMGCIKSMRCNASSTFYVKLGREKITSCFYRGPRGSCPESGMWRPTSPGSSNRTCLSVLIYLDIK